MAYLVCILLYCRITVSAKLDYSIWDISINIYFIEPSAHSQRGQIPAAAVVATATVPAGERREFEFSLAWDMPVVYFGSKKKKHYRYWVELN